MKFGTDGVRGVANSDLTAAFALSLGRAAARVLGGDEAVVGGDTRVSTAMLEAAFVAGLALVYLVPPVAVAAGAVAGSAVAAALGAVAWLVMSGTYVPLLRHYRQPLWLAPLLPFTAALYLLMTVDSAVQHHRGRGAAWKGRTYARPDALPDEG